MPFYKKNNQGTGANKPKSEWAERKIGAFWIKEKTGLDGKPEKYLMGNIDLTRWNGPENVRVMIAANTFKEKENQPDRIALYLPDDDRQQKSGGGGYQKTAPQRQAAPPARKTFKKPAPQEDLDLSEQAEEHVQNQPADDEEVF